MTFRIKRESNFNQLLGIFILVLVSFFVGLTSIFLPWTLNLALFGGVFYLLLIWFMPWVGFATYILLMIVLPDFKIADVVTLVTLFLFVLRVWRTEGKLKLIDRTILIPFLLFTGIFFFSLFISKIYFHNSISYMYRDGRSFFYWAWFPIITLMLHKSNSEYKKLLNVLFSVAIAVATIAMLQGFLGVQIVSGRVSELETSGVIQSAFTRVQMPGFIFVMFALIGMVLSALYRNINLYFSTLIITILTIALFLNFGRALWVWTSIGIILTIFFLDIKKSKILIIYLFASIFLVVSILVVFKPTVLDAAVDRIVSVKDEGGRASSYGWRKWENEDAVKNIYQSPLLGVGVGGEYRNWISQLSIFPDHTRYIHNSYLFIALKLGLPTLILYLWLFGANWNLARITRKKTVAEHQVFLISGLAVLPAILGLSTTQPEIVNIYGVILCSCIFAYFTFAATLEVNRMKDT